jgi:serine/threonine protein kinase
MASIRLADTPPPPLPGYERVCALGDNSGQNGLLFKERDVSANQLVAVKYLLRSEHTADVVRRELRNHHEHGAHQHVAGFRRAVLLPEWLAIVSELGDMDLRGWLNTQPGYKAEEGVARSVIVQLFGTVADLHARGVVHRDLKARNLVVPHVRDCVLTRDAPLQMDNVVCFLQAQAASGRFAKSSTSAARSTAYWTRSRTPWWAPPST